MRKERTLTSESVTEGHPDKVCDQISDAVLDECLRQDPNSRVACESMVKAKRNLFGTLMPQVYLMGEITTGANLDFRKVVRGTLESIGYDGDWAGFSSERFKLHVNITRQSPDIAIVNGTGKFVVGGPEGDSGLTGRKIIVDTYGGVARHGGGAFSGKDPTKVDRSAAYFARYIAKNIVVAGLAERCEVRFAFTIGSSQPDDFAVETFGTSPVDEKKIERVVREMFDFRPSSIIKILDLRRPIYSPTAVYGHFGRETERGFFTWERTDRVGELKRAFV